MPEIGSTHAYDASGILQVFRCIRHDSYNNQFGQLRHVPVWESECLTCGVTFEQARAQRRGHKLQFVRRCVTHRRKLLKRERTTAEPPKELTIVPEWGVEQDRAKERRRDDLLAKTIRKTTHTAGVFTDR